MATGFAGGTANVFENADENGDGVVTMDETASAFVKGFLAGAIAPDVIKTLGKTNPKLYAKVTSKLLDETANGMKASKEAIDDLSVEIGANFSKKEKRGIYNVTFNDKKSTAIRNRDLEDVIKYEKGFENTKNGKGFGSLHILKHLDDGSVGEVSKEELLKIGEIIHNGKMYESHGKTVYEMAADDGATLKVVVGKTKNAKERVITFYSDRNLPARRGPE